MRLEWRLQTWDRSSNSSQRSRTRPHPPRKLPRPALSWSHQVLLGTAANTKPTRWHEKNWYKTPKKAYLRPQTELCDMLQGLGVSPLTARRIGARPGSLPGVSRAHSTEPIPVRFDSWKICKTWTFIICQRSSLGLGEISNIFTWVQKKWSRTCCPTMSFPPSLAHSASSPDTAVEILARDREWQKQFRTRLNFARRRLSRECIMPPFHHQHSSQSILGPPTQKSPP